MPYSINLCLSNLKLIAVLVIFTASATISYGQQTIKTDSSRAILDGSVIKLPSIKAKPQVIIPQKDEKGTLKYIKPNTNLENLSTNKGIQFLQTNQYRSAGHLYTDALKTTNTNKRPKFKSDNYLGDFRSNSKYVTIICKDYDYVDGDRVKVSINDVLTQENILLTGSYQSFKIDLVSGFNRIDIEALNEGTSSPNTAEFKVFDDEGNVVSANLWNLTTGVKATMIIIKE